MFSYEVKRRNMVEALEYADRLQQGLENEKNREAIRILSEI